jgi:hypothetical protein
MDIRVQPTKNAVGPAVRWVFGLMLMTAALPAPGQVCSQPRNPQFYEDNGYTVRKIEIRDPFNFIFLVRHRLQKVKDSLSLKEGKGFSKDKYLDSAETFERAVGADDSFGDPLSHTKLVVKTAALENCQEAEGAPKTVDVVYRIFSTDPIPAVRALPEKRQASVEEPATTAGEESTRAFYKLRPLFGYENSRRGYGGVDLLLKIPGQVFDNAQLSATGSSTSRVLIFQLDGSKTSKVWALDRVDYHLSYNYSRLPASDMLLSQGSFQLRFTASSKPRETPKSRLLLRYGAAIEAGNQQSSPSARTPPPGTLTNSGYGTLRAYVGVIRTTRYSEAAASYGLQIGGTGLGDLSFAKHVGDVVYSRRFQGTGEDRHAPWDIQARVSLGRITGSKGIPINDRFFGGNSVAPFIPGDDWIIPNGPIVRSIPTNRLNAGGFGGSSFYSSNLTIGKVIVFKRLIPQEVEKADGFDSGITAAEKTAERFFSDDYLSATSAYKALVVDHADKLKADLSGIQATFAMIRSAGAVAPSLDKVLKKAESQARGIQNVSRHSSVQDESGQTTPQALSTLINLNTPLMWPMLRLKGGSGPGPQALPCQLQPSTLSSGDKPGLLVLLCILQPMVGADASSQLAAEQVLIMQDLAKLRTALDDIKKSIVGQDAAQHAFRDMIRPREIIDTLRHEVNSYSFSLVGVFDSGRLWPDPLGTRYAIGGGGRFSLVNVNFTAGYAINPHPRKDLGQGRGAIVFSLTYTNLFR